jgi:dihydrofolate reductase
VTLDDVVEDPGGDEGFNPGGWQTSLFEDLNAYARDVVSQSDALLLGRVTFEHFVQAWPSITEVESFAERMNTMPKFVSSRTLTEPPGWNATLIHGDALEEVNKLKQDRQK